MPSGSGLQDTHPPSLPYSAIVVPHWLAYRHPNAPRRSLALFPSPLPSLIHLCTYCSPAWNILCLLPPTHQANPNKSLRVPPVLPGFPPTLCADLSHSRYHTINQRIHRLYSCLAPTPDYELLEKLFTFNAQHRTRYSVGAEWINEGRKEFVLCHLIEPFQHGLFYSAGKPDPAFFSQAMSLSLHCLLRFSFLCFLLVLLSNAVCLPSWVSSTDLCLQVKVWGLGLHICSSVQTPPSWPRPFSWWPRLPLGTQFEMCCGSWLARTETILS